MYHIEIHLQASEKFSEFSPQALQELELAIENIVGCSLLQIVDTLAIDKVTVCYIQEDQTRAWFSIQNT